MTPLWLWPIGACVCAALAGVTWLDWRACRCVRHRCRYCRREAQLVAVWIGCAVLCAVAPAVMAWVAR